MSSRYGSLFQIDDFSSASSAIRLERISLSVGRAGGGYDERWLQRLVSSHPQALPIAEIESFLGGAVPICLELGTKAGPIDVLLVTPHGDIVLVECKLWRNPQARREVVGQIMDYAKELPRLSYEAFEAAIQKAEPASGAERTVPLHARTGAEAAGVDEAAFINAVTRNLKRGRFLLLIVGDGIQEGVEVIAEFLQQHAGMHFTLALVEVAIFKFSPEGYLVQPRVLLKTHMVPRGIVSIVDNQVVVYGDLPSTPGEIGSAQDVSALTRARPPATISEARLFELLDAKLPAGAERLRQIVTALEERGALPRFNPSEIVLRGAVADRTMTIATVDPASATVWFSDVVTEAAALGRRDAALEYYHTLANLVSDEKVRAKKQKPTGVSGTASLPADDLLSTPGPWLAAIDRYLERIADAARVQA